ncbi:MAG: transposase [Candidatus Vogelbacteria bacterium]|nr:transposase [Candidatus Vogelbacteria bacterium]
MDEVYHVYNRGVLKREIFLDDRDWIRFLFLILYSQAPAVSFDNPSRLVTQYERYRIFNIPTDTIAAIAKSKGVELIAFTLRPNHFHLLVRELAEGGLAKFLQRIGIGYTKYFNIKYQQTGHLFQNSYRSVLIEDNDQLLYTSAYIHKHVPKTTYEWSSYQDYIKNNRWGNLIDTSLILEQFDSPSEYQQWLKDCPAKEMGEAVSHLHDW